MEDYASMYYQKNIEALNEKLVSTMDELESVKKEARSEIMRLKEREKYLVRSLEMACQERDDAKEQLQKILFNVSFSDAITSSHFPKPTATSNKAANNNSSITESNSLSLDCTFNNNTTTNNSNNCPSPVDSFFDPISSATINNMMQFVNQQQQQPQPLLVGHKMDEEASSAIERLIKCKTLLPQKGKLLQAVQEAGPLLETLLVAGPVPRWHNPPPMQNFQIPSPAPVTAGHGRSSNPAEIAATAMKQQQQQSPNLQSHNNLEMPFIGSGSSQMQSSSHVSSFETEQYSGIDSLVVDNGGRIISAAANPNNNNYAAGPGSRQSFQ